MSRTSAPKATWPLDGLRVGVRQCLSAFVCCGLPDANFAGVGVFPANRRVFGHFGARNNVSA